MAHLAAIEKYLPESTLDNSRLAEIFPEWPEEKIESKTGFRTRHIAKEFEYSSDLGAEALRKLMERIGAADDYFDFLIVVCQSPDFILPNVSSMIHGKLGLSSKTATVDFSLGCSGYVTGLHFARSLISVDPDARVALVTTDTYSKLMNPADRSVRTIFGDGATATLIQAEPLDLTSGFEIGPAVFGSDGSGAGDLLVPNGQISKLASSKFPKSTPRTRGFYPSNYDLFMDGPAIFSFAIRRVPEIISDLVLSLGKPVDYKFERYIFHQANQFMLTHLVKKLDIPESSAPFTAAMTGNTVSSSIPLALMSVLESGDFQDGDSIALVGFGVGLSWGAISCRYRN